MNQCAAPFSPAKIQYLLKEAGYTQKRIAEEEGVSEMSVSSVIHFNRISKRLMIAVASRINTDPRTVFGCSFERAGIKGRPKKLK